MMAQYAGLATTANVKTLVSVCSVFLLRALAYFCAIHPTNYFIKLTAP